MQPTKPVWVNLASFMPRSCLDDSGAFWVQGEEVRRTAKRVQVLCPTRGDGVFSYLPANVKQREATQ